MSSSATKFDYENIVKSYMKQNVTASHLSDAKEIALVTYMNKLEEVKQKKLELLAVKRRNDELQREADYWIKMKQEASKQVDVYKAMCVEAEKKLEDVENKKMEDVENNLRQMRQLYDKYEALDDKFNPENINNKILEIREEKENILQRLSEKKAIFESLRQAYETFDMEVLNTDEIFKQAFGEDVKKCGDLRDNRNKLKNVMATYQALTAKMDKIPK